MAVVSLKNFLDEEDKADFDRVFEEAIMDCFREKEKVIQMNIKAFYIGKENTRRVHGGR